MKTRRDTTDRMTLALAAALLLAPCAASAQGARQVMEEAQKRTLASSQHYAGTLQVFDARGKITDKRWTFDRLGSHGSSKSILRFTDPPEVKGVALLVANHPDRASDQWMWTPAIQRDRRVALQDRSQRFFGTDFSFEDLEERDVDQYDFSMDGEETLNGAVCWRIDATPRKGKGSQYTKSRVWVRKDNYAYQKVESFIRSEVVRVLNYSDIQNVQGIWTGRTLEMTDRRRKSRTVLRLEELKYNLPMKEQDFTLQALRRDQ
jgi:outer membrane lipoprotein-sorting protein